MTAAIAPNISAAVPPIRSGKQRITPEVKRDISRIRLVKSAEEADNRYFSLDRVNHTALLSGQQFSLDWDAAGVKTDAMLLLNYFKNYEGALPKDAFTASSLRALQQAYRRFPVVFDDIGRAAFIRHGRDMIKNEMQAPVVEHPGFIVSMNAEPQSFPDEIVKRCLMIYTSTALPPHNEELRQRLQSRIQELRHGLTGQFYRRYLVEVMSQLDDMRLPEDWLALSSNTIVKIISEAANETPPQWCRAVTWIDYAEKRYDRVKARLDALLRPSSQARYEGELLNGWKVEGGKIIVWEQRDAFGRRGFDWEDVPSTLIDEESSGGSRTILYRASLEKFLGRRLKPVRPWWMVWQNR